MSDKDYDNLIITIHEKVSAIHSDMQVLKEKVGGETGLVAITQDHEERMRKIEKKLYAFAGAGAGLMLLVKYFL